MNFQTTASSEQKPLTNIRWTICLLLFFATTVNYLDRQLFSLLVPFFEDELKLGPTDLALINVSFLISYGFGMVFVGNLIDRMGTRKGLTLSFVVWNIASLAHAGIRSLSGFIVVRFALGVGESGNFPAAIRTVAEWFPKRERALATGWFNCGSNVGAVLAPILAVSIAQAFGWRWCFLTLGSVGFVWVFFWLRFYRKPAEDPRVSTSELEHIQSDPAESMEAVSYGEVFGMRPLYALAFAKFFTEAPWWFYLTWLPKFLTDQFHLSADFMKWAIPVVFLAADGGAIGGGWLSSFLIRRGRDVGDSRKLALLVCACCALPVVTVGSLVDRPSVMGIPSVYLAIAAVSLAAAAHQGWSSNMYTLISDTVPKPTIAMVVGILTAFGVVGAAAFQMFVGSAVQVSGSYSIPFVMAGSLYLVGLAGLQVILPRVGPSKGRRVNMAWVWSGGASLLVALAFLQIGLNRPPYSSLADYERKRAGELHSTNVLQGPFAKVGWMKAEWLQWTIPSDPAKLELVKFDQESRPFIESKGTKATKYYGPTVSEVRAYFKAPK